MSDWLKRFMPDADWEKVTVAVDYGRGADLTAVCVSQIRDGAVDVHDIRFLGRNVGKRQLARSMINKAKRKGIKVIEA